MNRVCLAGATAVLVCSLAWWNAVHADTPVATSTPIATPAPTLQEPTATALPEQPPTVTQELSTPVISTPPPTVAAPTAWPSTETPYRRFPRPHGTPAATAEVATPTPISIPWPSPDQLRADAQLRWGKGIPASVRRWAFLIVPAARRYHLDPNLVAAVMTMESNGDPLALSGADARGLMQVLHGPWDPKANVNLGVRMLSSLYARFGDWSLALAAYNAGPGAVAAAGGIPPYRETHDYVIIVRYLWDLFGNKHLTSERRRLYTASLHDLRLFKDQRAKIARLARAGRVKTSATDVCASGGCAAAEWSGPTSSLDPFWPVGGSPDPLQHIDPYDMPHH